MKIREESLGDVEFELDPRVPADLEKILATLLTNQVSLLVIVGMLGYKLLQSTELLSATYGLVGATIHSLLTPDSARRVIDLIVTQNPDIDLEHLN